MKKICFIIGSLGSGGAERVISILSNYLIKKYKICIILLSREEIFYNLDSRIKIISLNLYKPTNSVFEKIKNNLVRLKILSETLKKEDPDIIISFTTRINILSIIVAKFLGKKIIISERINFNFLQSKIWRLLRKIIYKYSDALVVQSNFDKEKYSFCKNVKVIFNPLEVKSCNLKKENIILAVGRLDYQKGFDRLINAYKLLNTNWKLYIAGDGVEKENLLNLVKELGLENKVFFLGKVKNIEKYYSRASIFALSSRMEGFPNALIEAMGYGCACVAFDCLTGPRDIIKNNINGFLVPNGNIELFAKKIQTLIDNKDLRTFFSTNAKNIIFDLDPQKIVNEWDQLIKELLCAE